MKPPISYYGGKQRLASKIVPLIPKHTNYVEPFCGGAAILFAKPWPAVTSASFYCEVINDTDKRLINFYKQLRDNREQLIELLALTPYSKAEHDLAKDCDGEGLEAARRYFVSISQAFSNKLSSGWSRTIYGQNQGIAWARRVARLPEYMDRMAGMIIECADAIDCIKKWDSPQTFFYCDPPYPGADQGHYKGYSIEDFNRLTDVLNDCQGSFLLSCYDSPGMKIFDGWERFEFAAVVSSSCKGRVGADRSRKATQEELGNIKRTEVVYRRFNRVPARQEIQKVYHSGALDCFVDSPTDLQSCPRASLLAWMQ